MSFVRELLQVAAFFIAMLLVCDLLLTMHDIRNELRAQRLEREQKVL